MIKQSLQVWLRIIIGIAIFFILRYFIESNIVIISILVAVIILLVIYGVVQGSKNPADHLEVICNTYQFLDYIEKDKDKVDLYHLLEAYAYVHNHEVQEAKLAYSKVNFNEIQDTKHNRFIKAVVELKIAYLENDLEHYESLFKEVKPKIWTDVQMPEKTYLVHQYILKKDYLNAEITAKEVIPEIKKGLYIMELEYLLALSYYEQNKLDDCDAVSGFVIERGLGLVYTELCKNMNDKINRK